MTNTKTNATLNSFLEEFARNLGKMQKGADVLAGILDADVDVGATPKKLVQRRDKVELFRYEPLAEQQVSTPVLIVYGLIGRWASQLWSKASTC